MKRAEMDLFVSDQVKAADEHLRRLRALEERVRSDQRLEALWQLRRQGLSLVESMAAIDRQFPANDGE